MKALTNLIPDPATAGVWVPRPGAVRLADFVTANFATPGFISSCLVIGDIAYGTIASTRNAGKDEPFCFNLNTATFVTIAGILGSNTPISPPATGEWVPPILAQVGGRVVVCHPGFNDEETKFGWFDVSGFTQTKNGNTSATSPAAATLTGNMPILGVQPGMKVTGSGIPSNTSVVRTALFTLTTTGSTHTTTTLDTLVSTVGVAVGQTVVGIGIPTGTTVVSVDSATAVTLSLAATATAALVSITFGGTTVVMNNMATAAANGVSITIAGGTSPVPFTILTNTVSGSTTLTGSPYILRLTNGMTITGPGLIPGGTTIVSTAAFALTTTGDTHGTTTLDNLFVLATTGDTHTTTQLNNLASTTGVVVGMSVAGAGIPVGATVSVIVSGTEVTLSAPATATAAGIAVTFGGTAGVAVGQATEGLQFAAGTRVASVDSATAVTLSQPAISTTAGGSVIFEGATIVISNPAAATANNVSLSVAGVPLWGAGDTDRNILLGKPVGVAQFNGRAYYALGRYGIRYSDSLLPCRVSDTIAVQALTTNDGLDVTAIAPLLLSSPVTGGIVQALVAFEGASKMQQITGDQAIPATSTKIADGGLSTLMMNVMPVATGTLAPLSITPTERGLAFVSPQGLRFVEFNGGVSEPIGDGGRGITRPFIFSTVPSRICAAANVNVLRMTTSNGSIAAAPQEEYWYSFSRKSWSGPHTSTASLIQPWRSGFLMSFAGENARLYSSDAQPGLSSVYVERSAAMSWLWMTSLLPDSGHGGMVHVASMTLACQLTPSITASVSAINDYGSQLSQTTVTGDVAGASVWGAFNWGTGIWSVPTGSFRQRSIDWQIPLVFKQGQIQVSGLSGANVRIGNLYAKYQLRGYKLQEAA